jgi:benzoyl-CoA reductase/2-hydroxyglutaryl-CoA dehydratase subunit BcrC/BadD/HgdB
MIRVDIPTRMDTLHEFKQQGGSIAAVFPIHYPRELLRVFNYLPVEVWGPPKVSGNLGEAQFQPYICSIVRNALSFIQSSDFDVVDLLLVPHACDSLQGLGSLLIDFIPPRQPVLTLYLPRGRRQSDLDFLANEFRMIYHRLETITGNSPSPAELMASIHLEEQADGLLSELHVHRPCIPFDDKSFYRLLRSREYLPAEKFIILAQDILSQTVEAELQGTPIILSGIVPEPMDLFKSLSEMGARVVADDLACCRRRLYPAGHSQDPFKRMSERIFNAPPDPTRGSPILDRFEHLMRLVKASSARGVIFYDIKFCEPELFDLPLLRQGLLKSGIPSLPVEVDISDGHSQPVLNRLEAFLEMIQ